MSYPENLKYTQSHEWVKLENGQAIVGISQFAVDAIKEIVFLELPLAGKDLAQMKPFGVVESVKAVFDLNAPLAGKVVESNSALANDFQTLISDPYGKGWLIKLKPASTDTSHLMDAKAYETFCAGEHH